MENSFRSRQIDRKNSTHIKNADEMLGMISNMIFRSGQKKCFQWPTSSFQKIKNMKQICCLSHSKTKHSHHVRLNPVITRHNKLVKKVIFFFFFCLGRFFRCYFWIEPLSKWLLNHLSSRSGKQSARILWTNGKRKYVHRKIKYAILIEQFNDQSFLSLPFWLLKSYAKSIIVFGQSNK